MDGWVGFSLPIIRISWRIVISQLLNNIRQGIMLPADEDISWPRVVIDDFLDAFRIVAVTRSVDRQAEVLGQRFDGLVGTVPLAVCDESSASSRFISHRSKVERLYVPDLGVCAMI